MTKELRERFEKQFPRKRWITTLTIGGIHQLQEDVLAWHEQEIIEAERRAKEEAYKIDSIEAEVGYAYQRGRDSMRQECLACIHTSDPALIIEACQVEDSIRTAISSLK